MHALEPRYIFQRKKLGESQLFCPICVKVFMCTYLMCLTHVGTQMTELFVKLVVFGFHFNLLNKFLSIMRTKTKTHNATICFTVSDRDMSVRFVVCLTSFSVDFGIEKKCVGAN